MCKNNLTNVFGITQLSKVRIASCLIAVLVLGLLTVKSVPAQQPPTLPPLQSPRMPAPPDQPSEDTSTEKEEEPISTIKVGVDVVQLFFNVKDKKGGIIPNQTRDNFQVFED